MLSVILLATTSVWLETGALVLAALITVGVLFGLKILRDRQWTDEWWEPFCEAAVHYVDEKVTDLAASGTVKQQLAIQRFRELYKRATGDFPNDSIVSKAVKGIEVAYQIFHLTTNASGNGVDVPVTQ